MNNTYTALERALDFNTSFMPTHRQRYLRVYFQAEDWVLNNKRLVKYLVKALPSLVGAMPNEEKNETNLEEIEETLYSSRDCTSSGFRPYTSSRTKKYFCFVIYNDGFVVRSFLEPALAYEDNNVYTMHLCAKQFVSRKTYSDMCWEPSYLWEHRRKDNSNAKRKS